jgi:hypothetical protein
MVKKFLTHTVMLELFILACGVSIFFGSGTLKADAKQYPQFIGIILCLLVVLQLILEITKIKNSVSEKDEKSPPSRFFAWYKTLGFCIAYAVLIWLFGFIIATWLAIFFCYFILSEKRSRIIMIAFPTLFTALVYIIFSVCFYVRLPKGLILSLLR